MALNSASSIKKYCTNKKGMYPVFSEDLVEFYNFMSNNYTFCGYSIAVFKIKFSTKITCLFTYKR